CPFNIGNDSCCLVGAPCILFSKYGLKQGFKNVVLKKVHDVATKFMDETPVCVHENVPGYEQVGKSS
ncbi:unnamed protein product, partial [Durusdinium trenchii]